MSVFDGKIKRKFDVSANVPDKELLLFNPYNLLDIDEEDPEFVEEYNKVISDQSINHEDSTLPDTFDPYLNMEISLPRGQDSTPIAAHVKQRATGDDGKLLGRAHNNPLLDTRQYEVQFVGGHKEVLTANIIAENPIAQVDKDGHRQRMLSEIIDHRSNNQAV